MNEDFNEAEKIWRYHGSKSKLKTKFKKHFYKLIRPLFVKRIDLNEDFVCCECGEPVLKRSIFCSSGCKLLNLWWKAHEEAQSFVEQEELKRKLDPPEEKLLLSKDQIGTMLLRYTKYFDQHTLVDFREHMKSLGFKE